jgi:hypothetical protein
MEKDTPCDACAPALNGITWTDTFSSSARSNLFELPTQRLGAADGAVQRFLADDQPQLRSAWRT